MKYYKDGLIHIIELFPAEFQIVMCDQSKKNFAEQTYVNAGYFGTFKEGSELFTLPAGHVVCDYKATGSAIKMYCEQRGTFIGNKFIYNGSTLNYNNQFYGKSVSTLIVKGKEAFIIDTATVPNCDYAISGVPVIRNGADVIFASYVKKQGWDSSVLYGAWHTFVGLKGDGKIYIIGMKTSTVNMITSAEAYRKLKGMQFKDVIKLDGGGSFHMKVNGRVVASTSENRRINTVITIKDTMTNPSASLYAEPTRLLKVGSYGNDVKWLQEMLNFRGYGLVVDGQFGSATKKAVEDFQKKNKLSVDGIVGPVTIRQLKA